MNKEKTYHELKIHNIKPYVPCGWTNDWRRFNIDLEYIHGGISFLLALPKSHISMCTFWLNASPFYTHEINQYQGNPCSSSDSFYIPHFYHHNDNLMFIKHWVGPFRRHLWQHAVGASRLLFCSTTAYRSHWIALYCKDHVAFLTEGLQMMIY